MSLLLFSNQLQILNQSATAVVELVEVLCHLGRIDGTFHRRGYGYRQRIGVGLVYYLPRLFSLGHYIGYRLMPAVINIAQSRSKAFINRRHFLRQIT